MSSTEESPAQAASFDNVVAAMEAHSEAEPRGVVGNLHTAQDKGDRLRHSLIETDDADAASLWTPTPTMTAMPWLVPRFVAWSKTTSVVTSGTAATAATAVEDTVVENDLPHIFNHRPELKRRCGQYKRQRGAEGGAYGCSGKPYSS